MTRFIWSPTADLRMLLISWSLSVSFENFNGGPWVFGTDGTGGVNLRVGAFWGADLAMPDIIVWHFSCCFLNWFKRSFNDPILPTVVYGTKIELTANKTVCIIINTTPIWKVTSYTTNKTHKIDRPTTKHHNMRCLTSAILQIIYMINDKSSKFPTLLQYVYNIWVLETPGWSLNYTPSNLEVQVHNQPLTSFQSKVTIANYSGPRQTQNFHVQLLHFYNPINAPQRSAKHGF